MQLEYFRYVSFFVATLCAVLGVTALWSSSEDLQAKCAPPVVGATWVAALWNICLALWGVMTVACSRCPMTRARERLVTPLVVCVSTALSVGLTLGVRFSDTACFEDVFRAPAVATSTYAMVAAWGLVTVQFVVVLLLVVAPCACARSVRAAFSKAPSGPAGAQVRVRETASRGSVLRAATKTMKLNDSV